MAPEIAFVSRTQHYLKVKKPLLERQRRARINKCLDALKTLVAEFQNDDAILRMDKAEMLEAAIVFMRNQSSSGHLKPFPPQQSSSTLNGFRNGYMNAVNEVSRVMAGMPGMSVDIGKSVMTHLGCEFNRMLRYEAQVSNAAAATEPQRRQPLTVLTATTTSHAPLSPASSGYHSDAEDSCLSSPSMHCNSTQSSIWRPW